MRANSHETSVHKQYELRIYLSAESHVLEIISLPAIVG